MEAPSVTSVEACEAKNISFKRPTELSSIETDNIPLLIDYNKIDKEKILSYFSRFFGEEIKNYKDLCEYLRINSLTSSDYDYIFHINTRNSSVIFSKSFNYCHVEGFYLSWPLSKNNLWDKDAQFVYMKLWDLLYVDYLREMDYSIKKIYEMEAEYIVQSEYDDDIDKKHESNSLEKEKIKSQKIINYLGEIRCYHKLKYQYWKDFYNRILILEQRIHDAYDSNYFPEEVTAYDCQNLIICSHQEIVEKSLQQWFELSDPNISLTKYNIESMNTQEPELFTDFFKLVKEYNYDGK
jgi:hypothetical protein